MNIEEKQVQKKIIFLKRENEVDTYGEWGILFVPTLLQPLDCAISRHFDTIRIALKAHEIFVLFFSTQKDAVCHGNLQQKENVKKHLKENRKK